MLAPSSFLPFCWLLWIAAGTVLNVSLQWKKFFPFILQDALHYGKLKLDVAGIARRGFRQLNVPKSYAVFPLPVIEAWILHST